MKWLLSFMLVLLVHASLATGQSSSDQPSSDNNTEKQDSRCTKTPSRQCECGLPGFPGYPGARGDPGPKGDKGDQGLQGPAGGSPVGNAGNVGVVYTRWGHSSCPGTLVYSGRAGGPRLDEGGGANFLCMPDDPEYELPYTPGVQAWSAIYGLKYHRTVSSDRYNQNAPCAVCYTPNKTISLMIPAKANCPSGWTREYYGYLMSAYRTRDKRSQYLCIDRSLAGISGFPPNSNHAAVVYPVEASCKGLSCGPYDPAKELNCVVCTK